MHGGYQKGLGSGVLHDSTCMGFQYTLTGTLTHKGIWIIIRSFVFVVCFCLGRSKRVLSLVLDTPIFCCTLSDTPFLLLLVAVQAEPSVLCIGSGFAEGLVPVNLTWAGSR